MACIQAGSIFTCMKSPYKDDRKANAMATFRVYNMKAAEIRENTNKIKHLADNIWGGLKCYQTTVNSDTLGN